MKNKKGLKIALIVLVVLALLCGGTYAVYRIVLEGQNVHTISAGRVVFEYEEEINELAIMENEGKSDLEGKARSEYFEFKVRSASTNAETIGYYIFISQILSENNYKSRDIKIYLSKVNADGTEEGIVGPTLIVDLPQVYDGISKKIYETSFIFDGSNTSTQEHIYRLRIWLKEDFNIVNYMEESTNAEGEQVFVLKEHAYNFTVNVRSIADTTQ